MKHVFAANRDLNYCFFAQKPESTPDGPMKVTRFVPQILDWRIG